MRERKQKRAASKAAAIVFSPWAAIQKALVQRTRGCSRSGKGAEPGYQRKPPPPPGGFAVLVADAYVANSKATTNYGTAATLQLRQGTPSNNITYHTYLQFNVSGLTGPVTSAKLRLSVTDASPDGGSVFDVSNVWTETGINWNNAPQPTSVTPLASAGVVAKGAIVNINLPLAEFSRSNGTYSFELVTSSSDSAIYNSKQSSSPPQLVLTQ
jgi:hypothetical protein